MSCRFARVSLFAGLLFGLCFDHPAARAGEGRFKRSISYQSKNDLFANYYEGPQPSGTAAQMVVSPLPVPPHVGYTYTTYQPLMPHEYLYRHTRSHYAYHPGAGWTRSKVRYRTFGLGFQDMTHRIKWSNRNPSIPPWRY